jgi:UDP-glucose 4-epimerase
VIVDDLSLGRQSNVAHLLKGPNSAELHVKSVLDTDFPSLVEDAKVNAVFHLAANSDIAAGSRDRRVDLERTFLTTWHVLESMAVCGIRELVFASSSAIYGDVSTPTDEDFGPLCPVSFYGAAKLASEAYCSAYAERHGIRTWTVRFPNVVGARATHGVIYDFINRLLVDPSVLKVLGDGTQQKPYLHVSDLVRAMLLLWDTVTPRPYEVVNVAPSSTTSVRRIAHLVLEAMQLVGRTELMFGTAPTGWPGDVPKFSYDTSKIDALGWQGSMSSDEAVRRATTEIAAELSCR